jgi:transcriptional regulator with XRE-family HTH domain
MTGIGERLIRARETRGLTLEDAERDTRISRRYLQALETEQFEIIPAPVYARGFLRSYSQYVGLDPQEMLSLFPREPGLPPAPADPGHPSRENPASAVTGSRPAWQQPLGPPSHEPVIGVDIGVTRPSRRLNGDPAAQTRTALVAIVAIGAIVLVLGLAWFISNLGGDAPGAGPVQQPIGDASGVTPIATTPSAPTGTSGLNVTRGVVPDVTGETAAVALLAIAEAGLVADQSTDPSDTVPEGSVIGQSPAPGTVRDEGLTVFIVVSTGP